MIEIGKTSADGRIFQIIYKKPYDTARTFPGSGAALFAADAAYAALKRSFSYVDSFIETQIKDAKSEAETLFKKAKSQLNKDEAILSCNNALNICKDYPGIQEYIAQNFAPDAPMLLKVSCDSVNNVNIISWTPRDKSVGIRYKVIKKLSTCGHLRDGVSRTVKRRIKDHETAFRK